MIPALLWSVRLLGTMLLIGTLLPFLRTGKWWVRGWEMPRLQVAGLLLIVILLAGILSLSSGWNRELGLWITACFAAFVWQAAHVVPLFPFFPRELPNAEGNELNFKLLVVNLKFENTCYDQVHEEIADENSDLLLLIEPNQNWANQLTELRKQFKYHHAEIRDEGLGMAIWSNLPLTNPRTRFVVSQRRPSIWAGIELPGGESANLVCIHPTPPGLDDGSGKSRRDSRERDAELVLIAKEIASRADQSWIVAGDFNDVVWSHTTRLFKRLSGLKDPRVGRTFMGTFPAHIPMLLCPLDHVMLSAGFRIKYLGRLRITKSDHFGVAVRLSLKGAVRGVQPTPAGDDPEEAEIIIDEGTRDAKERDP